MNVICSDNAGFEDMLTTGKTYPVQAAKNGSYLVLDDKGKPRWFGTALLRPDL